MARLTALLEHLIGAYCSINFIQSLLNLREIQFFEQHFMAEHPLKRFIVSIAARVAKSNFFEALSFLLLLPVQLGFLMVLAQTYLELLWSLIDWWF